MPVLIFFHGGALQGGDKREQGFIATRFVSEGVGVVLANYRLSPMVMHPAHILDAAAVFAWVKRNIEKYGINTVSFWDDLSFAGLNQVETLCKTRIYLNTHVTHA